MIQIDLASSTPIVTQLEEQVRRVIAQGLLRPGDALPTVRQLAGDLGINLNTVARAYRALEADGLLVTNRGRGTTVRSSLDTASQEQVETRVREGLRKALTDAKLGGLDAQATERVYREVRAELFGGERQ